jgi:hypothetical protein
MDTFGVAAFLPDCSFEVEIPKDSILESIKDLDELLDKQNIPEADKITFVIYASAKTSVDLSKNTIDVETATSELAYNFVYIFAKEHKDDSIFDKLRGLVGIVSDADNEFYINGYGDSKSYKECIQVLKETSDLDEEFDITPKPTIH